MPPNRPSSSAEIAVINGLQKEEPRISERPSYFPSNIEDEMIPRELKEETRFWTTGKGQKLSTESAHALMQAEGLVTDLIKSGVMEEMGLVLDSPGHKYLRGHCTRVAVHALLTNDRLTKYGSPSRSRHPDLLAFAGLIHDIGKLHPEINRVVMSDKKYEDDALEAWRIIRKHPEMAAKVVRVMPGFESRHFREIVERAVGEHHENFDGTGYHGIMGVNICPEARILRAVDTADTIGERRTYKEAQPTSTIMTELEKDKRMYDPEVLLMLRKIQRDSGVFSRHRNSERP